MIQLLSVVVPSILLAARARAQQFPLPVTYDAILKSPINPNVTISYKRPSAHTCATAFETQKQYSGYVNLPPFTLAPYQNYSINTFFWFFESRVNAETAPLTIWLNGGPGSSSLVGLLQEIGPCEIIQLPDDTYGTQPRLWGWDRSSNLLFIDQPTQTGFSYDERINASIDLGKDFPFMLESREELQSPPTGTPGWRILNGTFVSGLASNTQNTTAIAARACWHFLQGFLSAFPQYNPGIRPNRTTIEPADVNIFGESYGGLYGPIFADFFEDQNDRRSNGLLPPETLEIRLDSIGIVSGVLDTLTASIAVANFTRSNTYGIAAIDLLTYQNAISSLNSHTGCRGLVSRCRSKTQAFDPEGSGLDKETNELCSNALDACNRVGDIIYSKAARSPYDIRYSSRSGPGAAIQEYLNYADVMQSIGAQVNFTQSSMAVFEAFSETGDAIRGTHLSSLAELLVRGVRVAFIYGDADIICNWYGGQNASLELARLIPTYSSNFPAAGYADIVVNASYVGGHVRQYGNLSFSRIFDAGHLVPLYQPETAFTVFSRIILGDDISMGHNVDLSTFRSKGLPDSSSHTNKVSGESALMCWIRDTLYTCTQEERKAINQGQGTVNNGIWAPAAVAAPGSSSQTHSQERPSAGASKTTTRTSSVQLTGVFTATTTPTPTATSGTPKRRPPFRLPHRAVGPLQPWDDKEANKERNSSLRQRGLIGGLGAAGGILLLLLASSIVYFCWRRHKKDAKVIEDTEKAPSTATRQVEPPIASRRPSKMEPIPEQSPRPSEDIRQPVLSTHPESPAVVETKPPEAVDEVTLPVQRSVSPEESQGIAELTPVPSLMPTPPREADDEIMPAKRSVSPKEPQGIVEPTPIPSPVTTPPREPTPLPTPPPNEPISPLNESTSSLNESTPLKESTSPLKESTPPQNERKSPLNESTSSLNESTPPLNESTPPQNEPTSPSNESAPPLTPPRELTPPVPVAISPPQEPTPPRRLTPPISVQRSVSPPPRESGSEPEPEPTSRKPSLITRIRSAFHEEAENAKEAVDEAAAESEAREPTPPLVVADGKI